MAFVSLLVQTCCNLLTNKIEETMKIISNPLHTGRMWCREAHQIPWYLPPFSHWWDSLRWLFTSTAITPCDSVTKYWFRILRFHSRLQWLFCRPWELHSEHNVANRGISKMFENKSLCALKDRGIYVLIKLRIEDCGVVSKVHTTLPCLTRLNIVQHK